MPLAPGVRLGPYDVIAQLGVGGMGEVWRATDTNLKRAVAIKVLPEAVAADRDRLARFQREAEVLAALNHPNIAHIHGLEKSGGTTALVMELVEGPTLADRIARAPLPLDEALAIAKQITEALEAAHEQGIVHRDLKPANVKVREDGTVKVLDFGLAKALEPPGAVSGSASMSPTITSPAMTQAGMILGTAAYMSPEQARGRAVDKRADIWAFGCVLYEMLTGRRVFAGEDVSETLANVLKMEPAWEFLSAEVPARIQQVIRACLQKNAKQRIGDMQDVRLALDGAFETAAPPVAAPAAAPLRPWWRRAIPLAVTAIVAAALTFAVAWSLRPSPPPLAVTRFVFPLPEGQTFTNAGRNMVAISPDGARMAYVANSRLYLRSFSDVDARPMTGTESLPNVINPVFSPDGQSVAFYTTGDATIKRIAVTGGAAVTIAPATLPFGMSWGPDGIVFGQAGAGILRVSAAGGTPQVLVKLNEDETADGPQVLPDGEHVLFTLATGTAANRWDQAKIIVQSLASDERRVIVEGGSNGRYLPTGHVVYALGGTLFAVGFDARRSEVTGGGAVSIVEGVRRAPLGGTLTGVAHFSVSDTGSLIFVPGPALFGAAAALSLALIDRKGVVESLNLTAGPYSHPRVSPNGRRVALVTDDPKEAYISIYDLDGGTAMRRLTFGGNNRFPIWSRDSQRVTFQSDRDGDQAIFWQLADGTGEVERLTKPDKGTGHVPESWSPNDETLLFGALKQLSVPFSLWTFSRASRKEEPFGGVQSWAVTGAVFSPDGRWVAYSSGEAGRMTVYVQPFPATRAIYQLAGKSGDQPHHQLWSPDGRELFYTARPSGFAVVPVTTQPTFAFGNPTAVPRPFVAGLPSVPRLFDITPNGKFLGLVAPGEGAAGTPARQEIQVVVNWFEELKRLVPVN